jgi:hypothetical protein
LDTNVLELVSRISRIDEAVLADTSILPTLSVAKKMSWAAHRETTKPEDIAYCLLGIFDVNMPLLYGEGQKAFMRLQEEIIKRSNDLSIFAWGHPETTRPVEEGEDVNSPSITQTACCDLFAESPSNFSNCGDLVLQTAPAQCNFAFSLTNNGLFLSQMKLRMNFENGCYFLPLLCHEKKLPLDGTYLALKKVGPNLFVRLKRCHWENLFRWNQKVDGYVTAKITPETKAFVENCHVESVQLRCPSCSNASLHASILEISSQEMWDPSNLTFLHDDDDPFSGHVKLDGTALRTALAGSVGQGWDDIYLAWGRSLDLTDPSEPNHIRETVWVRLYWAGDWEEYLCVGEQSALETDNIRRGPEIIEAEVVTIGDLGSEYFRINIKYRSSQ